MEITTPPVGAANEITTTYMNYIRDHQATTKFNASTTAAFRLFRRTGKTNAAVLNNVRRELP